MMDKNFEMPTATVILFETEDVITTSGVDAYELPIFLNDF